MTRTKKVLIGLGGTLVVLVAALVLVVALFDWNQLKPTINERVSAAIGRPFAINGELTVQWRRPADETGWRSWVPWPRIAMEDVAIGNPDWAEDPHMATLQRAEFSLSPLPLLARRVMIRQIQLTGPAASLQRLKDGRANWVFTLPESGEPSPWVMDIDKIGFDQGKVRFRDETLRADVEAQIDPLGKPIPFAAIAGKPADAQQQQPESKAGKQKEQAQAAASEPDAQAGQDAKREGPRQSAAGQGAAPPDYVFGWRVKGRYKGLPLRGEGKIGGMLAMRDTTLPFPLQADVSVGDTRIALAGTLTDPANLGALDLRLELSGATMSDLYPLTGVTLPDTPRYATDGRLVARLREPGGAVFHYRDFNGKVGASDLHGDLTFTAGAPRPKLAGKLNSRLLRMRDLGPLVGVQPDAKTGKAAGGKPRQASGKVLPTQEFRTDRWRVMDADVTLTADRIIYDEDLPITKFDVHLVMDNGLLTLDPLRFGMAGGSIDTKLRLDGGRTPMAGKAEIAARGLRLKQLFPKVESMQRALGQLNGNAALTGTGNSVAALLGSASGDTRLLINDGVISRALMEIAGLNVGNYVVSKLFGDEEVKINCGAADLQMQRGVMTPRVFVFDTENALVQIEGNANFKDETLDLDITPRSKGVRVFSLRSPLYVRGTFGDPQAGVQVLPLAARGAGAVALGVLLTPVASLLALVAPSAGAEENQCAKLLQEMRQPPKAPPAKGRAGGK